MCQDAKGGVADSPLDDDAGSNQHSLQQHLQQPVQAQQAPGSPANAQQMMQQMATPFGSAMSSALPLSAQPFQL